jgi:hypothetical protein
VATFATSVWSARVFVLPPRVSTVFRLRSPTWVSVGELPSSDLRFFLTFRRRPPVRFVPERAWLFIFQRGRLVAFNRSTPARLESAARDGHRGCSNLLLFAYTKYFIRYV